MRGSLLFTLLLSLCGGAFAQLDTLDLIEAAQLRMGTVDHIRSRPPTTAWAKLTNTPALVPIDLEADSLPEAEQIITVYHDAGGIAAISTMRRTKTQGALDASTHYFDQPGRTLAVRWELSMHVPGCAADTAIVSKEEYYAPDGGLLDRWTWLTDADGRELDARTCKVPEPAGRTPRFRDRASLMKALRLPTP